MSDRLVTWLVIIGMLVGLAVFITVANAEPPPGVNPTSDVHTWFEGLVRSDGMHCCGEADCRVAQPGEVRAEGSGYEVLVDGSWKTVPAGYVVDRESNPLDATIICMTREPSANRLYCVVPFTAG